MLTDIQDKIRKLDDDFNSLFQQLAKKSWEEAVISLNQQLLTGLKELSREVKETPAIAPGTARKYEEAGLKPGDTFKAFLDALAAYEKKPGDEALEEDLEKKARAYLDHFDKDLNAAAKKLPKNKEKQRICLDTLKSLEQARARDKSLERYGKLGAYQRRIAELDKLYERDKGDPVFKRDYEQEYQKRRKALDTLMDQGDLVALEEQLNGLARWFADLPKNRNVKEEADAFHKGKVALGEIAKKLKGSGLSDTEKDQLKKQQKELEAARIEQSERLFFKWKAGKGWLDKSPEEILKEFGYNWFKMKRELAYVSKEDQNAATEMGISEVQLYETKLGAMETMVRYRNQLTDALIEETIKAITQRHLSDKPDFVIKPFAPGSVTPTSDIDINFVSDNYPEIEYEAVKFFNELFQKRYKVPPGVMLDVNAYTSGFMPAGSTYKDKFNPKGRTQELSEREQSLVRKGKTEKHQTQLALSYVSILQFFDQHGKMAKWEEFKKNSLKELNTFLVATKKVNREVYEEARKDLEAIFKKAEGLHKKTQKEIAESQKKASLDPEVTGKVVGEQKDKKTEEMLKDTLAKDALYEKYLGDVSEKLGQLKENASRLSAAATDKQREELLEERSRLIVEFEEAQGKANIFGNEMYFSGGAAVHVVKGMQAGQGIEIKRQQKMQSLLMNIGYKLQHFTHQEHDDGEGPALVNTSKYGSRIANIALGEAHTTRGDLDFSMSLSDTAREMLRNDIRIEKDYKKDDERFPNPQDKAGKATDDFPEMARNFEKVLLEEVGVKILGPYYYDRLVANVDKSLDFW